MNSLVSLLTVTLLALACSFVSGKGSFPRVRIFSPVKGTIWLTGETRTIFWRIGYEPPPPIPPTVNITLRRKSDATFRLPLTTFYATENFRFLWKIPDSLPSQDDYYIRIIPNRKFPEGRPHIMASKSKPFTVINKKPTPTAQLTLTNPTVGTVWYGGQFRYLQWNMQGLTADAVITIFIEDTKTGVVGRPFPYVIASKLPATPSVSGVMGYRWQVPYSFRTSDGYQIRLVAEFPEDPKKGPVTSTMAGLFTIVQVGDASRTTPTPGPALPTIEP